MGLNKNRGLSTLMGDVGEVYSRELGLDKNQVSLVEISKITPNPFQPRKTFDEAALN
ncbi:chromosome partitioning protein ParB, partial [Campylobacter jejuni]|nr:chromosome partitioning protein ParB [Campylobacter jejuni]